MTRPALISSLLLAACSTEQPEELSVVGAAVSGPNTSITRIRVNGDSSSAYLNDPATGAIGDVVVSRDNIEHTTSLNFSYLTPTANPEISMLVQGAGEIPNAAYTTTNTTARLVLPSTPFVVQRCAINTSTGDATCAPGPTVAWNLTWTQSGYSEIERFTLGREKVGPVTTRYAGWFREHSAIVNGTWNGNVAVDNAGFLRETMGSTVNIEVAVTLN